MSSQPTLLVLAAGMGSRYGGLKQIDPMGPHGEMLLDYSIHDAIQAGFGKVVFIIRPEIEQDFRELVGGHVEKRLPVSYVHQQLSDLPAGFSPPADRRKPWGTGHAILVAESAIAEPFCVINGDDFYGPAAYAKMADFLRQPVAAAGADPFAMVAYRLRNTLSEHGTVARGVCRVSPEGLLREVVERTAIAKEGNGARYQDEAGTWQPLTGDELVSLNLWGFTPAIFGHLRRLFRDFLAARGSDPKAEFFIPTVVDALIRAGQAACTVLESPDTWFGVTYPDDKPLVQQSLRRLIEAGTYPQRLRT